MFNIIRSDMYRIFKGKAVYIAILVLFAALSLDVFMLSPGHIGLSSNSIPMGSQITDEELTERLSGEETIFGIRKVMLEYGGFPLDKQIMATNVNLYYFFIVIVAVILTTDLSNSTGKNTLSSAVSREKYYISKLAACLIVCTGMIIINNVFLYLADLLINGPKFVSDIGELIRITLYQLPLLYGIISLLVAISFMTRRTAIFNSVCIPLVLAVQMIIISASAIFKLDSAAIMKYEIQCALSALTVNPSGTFILQCLALGTAYVIIFNVIGYLAFKRAEIK